MATILAFPTAAPAASPALRAASTSQAHASAELIFFPGVRYERAQPASEPQGRSRRARRPKTRDRIELAK